METAAVKNPPQPWRISIRAKAFKNFDLNIVASSTFLSSCRLETTQFSILVKIRKFFLKVESEPVMMKKTKRSTFKSRFLKLLGKLRLKRDRNQKFVPDTKKTNSDTSKPAQIGFPSNRPRKKEPGFLRNVGGLFARWVSVTDDVQGGTIIICLPKRLIYFAVIVLVMSLTIYYYFHCWFTTKFVLRLVMSRWRRLIVSWWRWSVSSDDFVRNILSSIGGALNM